MNTITGISFYDALTKLTIGFLLTWWWLPSVIIENCSVDLCDNYFSTISNCLYIIACFITGCLWQSIAIILPCRCSTNIFKPKVIIRKIIYKVKYLIRKTINEPKYLIQKIKYIHKLIPYGKSNYTLWIILKYRHIYNNHKENDIMHQYLKAYYNTQKKGLMGNIPKIEALEAFLRYAFVPFIINVIYIFRKIIVDTSCCWSILFFLILLSILIFLYLHLWKYYNQKVYELVWEADKYLKEIEKEKDNNFPNDINIIPI